MNYYVFHRNGIPLLLLPSDKRAALKTLSLYLPQSTKAKLAHAFLYTICNLGITRFFLKRATLGELTQNIIKFYKTKEPDASLGFLVCNPDHGERVIALKYTKHHSSIVKATTLDKKESLLKEHENIRRFSGTPGVPSVHPPITTESCIMLEMPYYKKSRIKSLGDKRIQTLLTNWKQKNIVHGDFALWNIREANDGSLVAIDWEWAEEKNAPTYDLLYAIKREGTLVRKISEENIDSYILTTINKYSWMKDFLNNTSYTHMADNGLFIAFEGADGVGKSTIMKKLIPLLIKEKGYNGFVFFHWKPLRKELSINTFPQTQPHNPRGKIARNPLLSILYLSYHYACYWYGYFRFIRPALKQKRLVVADRYSFDIFLDPQRFRLSVPTFLLRVFVKTLPQPERTIALVASPSTIISRKPELNEQEIASYQSKLTDSNIIKHLLVQNAEGTPDSITQSLLAKIFD